MIRSPLVAAFLALTLVACVQPAQVRRPVADPLFITESDIVQSRALDALDVVRRLRPTFLTFRGQTSVLGTSSPYPTVYVDGLRFGDLDILRAIPASQVATIRLYRAWDAMTRFGGGNMGGVIAITTRLGR
jgi:outer membrane cobalamin receptor